MKLGRQCPLSHHGDAHRIELLRRAIVAHTLTHQRLGRVAAHNLSFQVLYGERFSCMQLRKEA